MSIRSKVENALFATQNFKNWAQVIVSGVKGQEPPELVLKNDLRIESPVGLRALVKEIFIWKHYTPANLSIGDNDIVVDIGANTGVFTVYAASLTHNMVYAFEPFPSTCEILRRNVDANRLSNVEICPAAFSDKVGSATLFLNPSDSRQNLLSEHILPDKIEKYPHRTDLEYLHPDRLKHSVEVPTTTLQAFMNSNKLERIDFLKLDCEGAEAAILQSTPLECLKKVRKIAIEFHDHLSPLNHDELQGVLEEAGFITELKWESGSPLGFLYGWRNYPSSYNVLPPPDEFRNTVPGSESFFDLRK